MQPQRSDDASLQALWTQGLALHQAGRIEEARQRYEAVLAAWPDHCDSLHMLGVFNLQIGQLERGAGLIEQALRINPNAAHAHGNLANALNGLGRHEAALESCDRAIALQPDFADAHGNRGLAFYRLGRPAEALASYERVIALRPGDARARYNRGAMLRELGRLEEALGAYERAIALEPAYAEAHGGAGIVLRELGRSKDALASLAQALALKPDYVDAHYNQGIALRDLGRPADAVMSYERTLALRPDYAEALSNRGNALTDLKRYEEALASYDQAIALKPDYAEAYSNRVTPLRELRRPQEALASCDRAIALKPDYAEAHNNRAGALYEFRRMDEVMASFEQAFALKPDYAEAYCNRGVVFYELRRLDEALADLGRAIALKPDYAEAHYIMAMVRLTLGDYADGWARYEWRWRTRQFETKRRDLEAPLWLGREDLQGRAILLQGEQGLGDVLQFCRYVPKVAALGATVVLEVYAGLERLLGRLEGVDQVIVRGATLPSHDFQTPLLSLPLALGAGPDGDRGPYLSADPLEAAAWAERLAGGEGLRVGLCWAGGSRPDQPIADAIDKRRSLSLQDFAPLAGVEGVQFYSLQKGPPAAQLAEIRAQESWPGAPIIDVTAELRDFADTAALTANLDLLIVCDTSMAHLAGGMGKPVWVLNRFDACWRWLTDREDSPWYPSARLFSQTAAGDWDSVVEQVRRELAALAAKARTPSAR
jgi:tetratricopeptide (TPR) repeat protein